MSRETKNEVIGRLIAAYRASSSQESAFDALAAAALGIGLTDLRCLDLIQSRGGLTAGELATASGLTTGAVTAVADRLERAGLARRVRDDADRRKVNLEVTERHYEQTGAIWGPLMRDWQQTLAGRFSAAELATITEFLETVTALAERHGERVREEGGVGA
jgi:DNA-binding MarR family transcriptional regulator